MRIVLLGPPGGGKGTQAVKLAERFKVAHIATGDLFRQEIAAGSPLGVLADEYISNGNLVPDEVTNEMVASRLRQEDAAEFVLDGYRRTLSQAQALDAALETMGRPLDGAIWIRVPDEAIVGRAVGRLLCPNCGAIYHLSAHPPQVAGICDVCRSRLIVRDDDTPSTVRHRLAVYHRITEPLLGYYKERGLLKNVDGVGEVQIIFDRLVALLTQSC
jgi:adenylate kinase